MTARFLRNIVDGTIYRWHPILAANPKCVEVSEQEAFPEKFLDKKQVAKVAKSRKARGAAAPLSLDTEDIPEPPDETPADLAAEASKGMP